jgi:hypothetical protein
MEAKRNDASTSTLVASIIFLTVSGISLMASEREAKLIILPFNLSRSKQNQSFVLERQLLKAVLPRSRPLLQSSLQLHEDADWREGGPCGGSVFSNII